ncbi:sigma-70 family RNA polymerase sigma factor [Longirhabdus pacifica]|uniref:sigma-70 family RNA polymerase sigma factor n=1 Tax=Longirhabdus pacifica TaxID=2305227 RepID=UPI0010091DAE|nr:FliA/WhiG family RNA polymerase sigma factor [Longirhabdus pacifica]
MRHAKQLDISTDHLWQEWKYNEDAEARNDLIENYIPLVDYVASRMAIGLPSNVSRDDLHSYGIMGLIDAVHKFDITRNLQFETYASWRIKGAIIDGLRQVDWVPRSVREKAKKMEEAYRILEQKHLRTATDEEICEYLEVDKTQFHQMLQDISFIAVSSLEEPIASDEMETKITMLVDEKGKKPEHAVKDVYLKEMLSHALKRLTEKERMVVSLLYYEDLTLSEIAEVMSLTPSRISQLHSKAILRLRGSLSRQKQQLMFND